MCKEFRGTKKKIYLKTKLFFFSSKRLSIKKNFKGRKEMFKYKVKEEIL